MWIWVTASAVNGEEAGQSHKGGIKPSSLGPQVGHSSPMPNPAIAPLISGPPLSSPVLASSSGLAFHPLFPEEGPETFLRTHEEAEEAEDSGAASMCSEGQLKVALP